MVALPSDASKASDESDASDAADASTPAGSDTPPLWVICLCAEWCNVCRDWRSTFEEAARTHPQARFAWVDVEDEDEAMGDVDIETFPTVMVARGSTPLFLGPVQPSLAQVNRLVESLTQSATDDTAGNAGVTQEAQPLLARLQAVVLPKL